MNDSVESEETKEEAKEEFHKATLALEEIAEETERERDESDGNEFVLPEGQHETPPLKGPHHTPSKE